MKTQTTLHAALYWLLCLVFIQAIAIGFGILALNKATYNDATQQDMLQHSLQQQAAYRQQLDSLQQLYY